MAKVIHNLFGSSAHLLVAWGVETARTSLFRVVFHGSMNIRFATHLDFPHKRSFFAAVFVMQECRARGTPNREVGISHASQLEN